MTKRRFTPWVVLACIGTLAACTSGEGGTAGNTELNVIVPTNAGTPDEIDINTVEYTITCLGNDDTFLDNNASFADEVRIDGNLEVVDGRTNPGVNVCDGGNNPGAICTTPASPSPAECQGTSPIPDGNCVSGADFGPALPGSQTEIWQGFMDLPPGACNMQLRARDNDGEVICTTDQGFFVTADTTTKVNLVLMCKTSFQAPVGSADFDATFSFNVGNFCPDFFVLSCNDSNPQPAQNLPPPNPPIAATTCEVRTRDGDSTCGNNCDPQACTPTLQGLSCVPGPDPGLITVIQCTAGTVPETALLDCEGDGTPDASCTLMGDQLGLLPEFLDGAVPCGTTQDCIDATSLPDVLCRGGFCDFANTNTLLNTSFVIACAPPGPPFQGSPGATITCTAVVTDGDNDCDKVKTVQINCPGLAPCDAGATPPPPDCDDGQECTADACNDSSGSAVCDNIPVANGTDCSDATSGSGLGVCLNGVCDPQGCSVTGCPDDLNECTGALQCDTGTEFCCPDDGTSTCASEQAPDPIAADTACDGTAPNNNGLCDGAGTCVDNCATTNCSDSVECTQDQCDPAGNAGAVCPNSSTGTGCCSNPNIPANACQGGTNALEPCADISECPDQSGGTSCAGFLCDAGGGNTGACDGSGLCEFIPVADYDPKTAPLTVGCTNNVTGDVSILGFTLTVDPGQMSPNTAFTADLSGIGSFTESFLDAAQFVIPGGVRDAQLIGPGGSDPSNGLQAAVALRGTGATGGEVILKGDTSTLLNFCELAPNGACDPANDDADGGNSDCVPVGSFNVCQQGFALVPVIDGTDIVAGGCSPIAGVPAGQCVSDRVCVGGATDGNVCTVATADADCPGVLSTCEPRSCLDSTDCPTSDCLCNCNACAALDTAGCRPGDPDVPCTKGDECVANGFCVNGDLALGLTSEVGTYTAGTSGDTVLFGWFDGNPPTTRADGTMPLPAAVFSAPVPPVGVRVSAGGLFVAVQCLGAVDSGGANGVAECDAGASVGLSCNAPFDNSNNACVGGVDNGQPCSETSATACSGGECVNADCGVGADCVPPDQASPTPDGIMIDFLVP